MAWQKVAKPVYGVQLCIMLILPLYKVLKNTLHGDRSLDSKVEWKRGIKNVEWRFSEQYIFFLNWALKGGRELNEDLTL